MPIWGPNSVLIDNPSSIELLVNSAKRYLGKPEYRIQLDELISREAERLLQKTDGQEFAVSGPWDKGAFRARVKAYEAISEGLARVAGVLGRWGDGTERSLIIDLVRALYAHAEKVQSGNVVYLGFRAYPTVLVFTGYGLGLTRARRWAALHTLFTAELARENQQSKRIIDLLFLWKWKGASHDYWKNMEGLEQRKTPYCDHQLDLFTAWANSFTGLIADFELLYERYELLGSLAYLEKCSETELEASLQSSDRGAWMPVGRIGWHSSNFERLIAEFRAEEFRTQLCKAGFAHGNPKFIDMFITNAARFAERMSWWF